MTVEISKREPSRDSQKTGRKRYEQPKIVVYGSLAELTRKTGGPGADNPGLRRSR